MRPTHRQSVKHALKMGITTSVAPAPATLRGRRRRAASILSVVGVFTTSLGSFAVEQAVTPLHAAAYTAPAAVTNVSPTSVTPASSLMFGGREQSVSINPANTSIVLSASELGGLYRSTDGGFAWSHVDNMPMTVLNKVQFAASDPSLVLVSGNADSHTANQGGLWRSTDGGNTWAHINVDTFCNPGFVFGFDIGTGNPGSLPVFATTLCGLLYSADSGQTWSAVYPDGHCCSRFTDVKTQHVGSNTQVYACGDQGFWFSANAGGAWSGNDSNSPVTVGSLSGNRGVPGCSIAVAPNDANSVFITTFDSQSVKPACGVQLQETDNANAALPTWTDQQACPGDRNGRPPFVVTHLQQSNGGPIDPNKFEVYLGDDFRIHHQTCNSTTTTPAHCTPGNANWPLYDGSEPHNGTDPADIAFDPSTPNGCPILEAGDGGIYRIKDCSYSPPIDDETTGLNAYDVRGIAGSVYAGHTDLYFGTQDDGLFDSQNVQAATPTWNRRAYDIYGLVADHTGPPSRVLYHACCGDGETISTTENPDTGAAAWSVPPGGDSNANFNVAQFGPNSYADIVPDAPPPAMPPDNRTWSLWETTDAGTTWTKETGASLPGVPCCAPTSNQVLQASGPASQPYFFAMLSVSGHNKIYKFQGPLGTSSVPVDITNNLQNPQFFGVNPANPLYLYAYDAGPDKMMRSTNGGASWVADNTLTSLITRSGQFKFNGQPLSIGFDGHSQTIIVGTNDAGVFASVDNGATWMYVRGSDQIPRVIGTFFDEGTGAIYVGSRGRGVWRVTLPQSDLSITKTHSPDPVTAGTVLTYSITVRNTGDPASAITVSDNLPATESYLSDTNSCVESPLGSGKLTCPVPDLPGGGSYSFNIRVLVHSNASEPSGSSTITNTATVASAESVDANQANNSSTDSANTGESSDLAVTKSCPSTASAGQTMTCTIYVDNLGPSDARNVVATDAITSSGTFSVSSATSSPAAACSISTPNPGSSIRVTCTIGNLPAASTSQTGRDTITVQLTANDAQSISDTAAVRTDTPDPNPENNSASSSIAVSAASDLRITTVSGTPSPVDAGTNLTYVLNIQNSGPSTAVNVKLKANIPAGVTVVSVASSPAAGCNAGVPGDSTQPAVCNFGNMASGATASMTIVVHVNPQTTGLLHLDTRVSSDTFDTDTSNNLAHVDTPVTSHADLGVTISNAPNPVTAGNLLTYTAIATNNGPSTALNVTLAEGLPTGTTFNGLSVTHGSANCTFTTPSDRNLLCQLGTLNPGDSVTVVVSVRVLSSVPPTTVLQNTATVASDTPDPSPDPTPDSQTASATVNTSADVGISQSSDVKVLQGNPTINDTVTVTNAGPSDARTVVVTIQLPPQDSDGYQYGGTGGDVDLVTSIPCTLATTTSGNVVNGTLTCNLGTMTAGTTTSFVVTEDIEGNQTSVSFQANVTSTTSDPNTTNNASNLTIAQPVDITCTDQTLTNGYKNVTVASGHGCLLLGATVVGNITGSNITYLGINGTTVSGDVKVSGLTGNTVQGYDYLCNSNIGGQLQIQSSGSGTKWVLGDAEEGCSGGGTSVTKDVQFQNNAGTWTISDNDFEAKLQCSGNSLSGKDDATEDHGSNYVVQPASDQCSDLETTG